MLPDSIEAMNSRGRITIRTYRETATGMILVQFMDAGKGVPSFALDKVLHGQSIGKTSGQGLGLSHARSCLTLWGGSLNLESCEGVGTILSIRIKQSLA
ncbi:MAG: ATP-binding protein [Calothrix sp. SM1_5_4]|nr:ATP-binding protein [Calothrix sp. SM1_5_4]